MLKVFLFVCVAGAAPGTPNFLCKTHKMPTMDVCAQAVATFKATPTNATSDKESRVFIYCASDGRWQQNNGGAGQ